MTQTKTCANCGQRKPLDNYYAHPTTADGLNSWCQSCVVRAQREARLTVAKTERARKRLSRRRADASPEELQAVEEMAELMIDHRNDDLEKDGSGRPVRVPMDPVDELREEADLSWKRWHRLCSIAVDVADARMMDTLAEGEA